MKDIAVFLAAVLFAATVNAAGPERARSQPRCGVKVVSYKFVGEPGTKIVYGGKSLVIHRHGDIEVIATGRHSAVQIGDKTFNLPQSGADAFGSVTVDLHRFATVDR